MPPKSQSQQSVADTHNLVTLVFYVVDVSSWVSSQIRHAMLCQIYGKSVVHIQIQKGVIYCGSS